MISMNLISHILKKSAEGNKNFNNGILCKIVEQEPMISMTQEYCTF